ncbi:MAG: hypothetical protein Tsb005_12110 [Gammaproteobacteria bacterium]
MPNILIEKKSKNPKDSKNNYDKFIFFEEIEKEIKIINQIIRLNTSIYIERKDIQNVLEQFCENLTNPLKLNNDRQENIKPKESHPTAIVKKWFADFKVQEKYEFVGVGICLNAGREFSNEKFGNIELMFKDPNTKKVLKKKDETSEEYFNQFCINIHLKKEKYEKKSGYRKSLQEEFNGYLEIIKSSDGTIDKIEKFNLNNKAAWDYGYDISKSSQNTFNEYFPKSQKKLLQNKGEQNVQDEPQDKNIADSKVKSKNKDKAIKKHQQKNEKDVSSNLYSFLQNLSDKSSSEENDEKGKEEDLFENSEENITKENVVIHSRH